MVMVVGRFAQHKIVLADELVVVQHVQLLAGAELLPADAAREAVEVEDFVARFPHQVGRCDAVAAAAALGAVPPARGTRNEMRHQYEDRRVCGWPRCVRSHSTLTERNRCDSRVSPRG